jgi:hypothetical protein
MILISGPCCGPRCTTLLYMLCAADMKHMRMQLGSHLVGQIATCCLVSIEIVGSVCRNFHPLGYLEHEILELLVAHVFVSSTTSCTPPASYLFAFLKTLQW